MKKIFVSISFFLICTVTFLIPVSHAENIMSSISLAPQDESDDVIAINVTGNGYSDDCYVIYRADASDDYDFNYDALKFPGLPAAPQLYTKKVYNGNTMDLAVNAVNSIAYLDGKIVYLKVGAQGQYTISFTHTMVQAFQPVLRDRLLDIIIQPNQNYVFTASPSDNLDRFEILNSGGGNCNATITQAQLTFCSNNSAVQFTSEVSGGVWSGNGINASGLFTPATAGAGTHQITYSLTGTCSGTSNSVTVTVNAAPSVNLGPDQTICQGNSVTLNAGAGFTSYLWSPSGNTQTIQVTQQNTYSVTVTNASNCTASDNIIITVQQSANAQITTSQLTYCTNEASVMFTSLQSGGTWSGNGISAAGLFNPATAGAGTHTITYTISGTCGDSKSVQVLVKQAPSVELGPTQTICQGNSVTLDAGAGFSSYAWSPSGNTQTIQVTQQNTYSVTVTAANGCQANDNVTINVNPSANATITTNQLTYCSNDNSVIFTSLQGGGTWSGNGISAAGLFNPATAGAGTHTITYTISGTCGDSKSIQVLVKQAPSVELGPTQTICQGNSVTLDAGAGFSSYAWSPSGNTQTIQVTQQNTYSVTVTAANGCQANDNVTINVNPAADATITTNQLTYCTNSTPILFTSTQGGGIWSGTGINAAGLFNPVNAGAGTHTITYTIAGTCGDTKSVQVTVNQAPSVELGPNQTICQGTSLTLDAGAGFASYAWSPSGNTQTIEVTQQNTYSVTVTSANNCQASDNIVINVTSSSDATITTSQLSYCSNNQPVVFTSLQSGGTWSGSGINASGTFNPAIAGVGTHTITYTIAGSCGDSKSVEVTVHQAPTVELGSNQTICQGESLTLDAGAGFSSYAWTPSGNTQTIEVTQQNTYSVTVTDANNCQANDNIVINVNQSGDATITTTTLVYCTNNDAVNFTSLQAGGIWSGNGINAAGLFNPANAGAGTHTITYTIAGTCGDIKSVQVIVNQAPSVELGQNLTLCTGESITLDAGDGFVSYIWNPSGNAQTLTVNTSNTYSVTVSDENNCNATDAITVNFTESADATITTSNLQFCTNDQLTMFTAVDPGGLWEGTGISANGQFDPASVEPGQYVITYTIAGSCGDNDQVTIEVSQSYYSETSSTICAGESIEFGGQTLNETGVYTQQLSTINGCDSIIVLDLTVHTIDVNVEQNSNLLSAINTTADMYQWVDCANSFAEIDGANESTFEATENGQYAVIITEGDCSLMSECFNVVTVGIKDNSQKKLSLFPNPAKDIVYINSSEISTISVIDIYGRSISSQLIGIGTTELNVSTLSNGIYFIKQNGNNTNIKLNINR